MHRSLLSSLVLIVVLGAPIYVTAQQPDQKNHPITATGRKPREFVNIPEAAQPVFSSARQAMEWLKRTHKADGRFVYGFQPSLCVILDGDNITSQAGAAFALARSARYFGDEAGTVKARQAILTLLLETMLDPGDASKSSRHLAAPAAAVDRLSAHGVLISAIHELHQADKCADLLQQADQLCNYLRAQQRADGSIIVSDGGTLVKCGTDEIDAERAGWALQGIIRSQKLRPAEWKLDMLRKACAHYQASWQAKKSVAAACALTPAYVEAFALTKDRAYKDAVYAMTDWLIGLQFPDDADPARRPWVGGFKQFRDGKIDQGRPDIQSALPAESLAEACRMTKLAGDLEKLRSYERALLMNLQFLTSLQYNMGNTKHFVDPFRPSIIGAFHASHQDGNLRIDYTRPALCSMIQYLDKVVE